MDLPVKGQPENDEKVVEQYQGSQEKIVQTHLCEPISMDGLAVVHHKLGLTNSVREIRKISK